MFIKYVSSYHELSFLTVSHVFLVVLMLARNLCFIAFSSLPHLIDNWQVYPCLLPLVSDKSRNHRISINKWATSMNVLFKSVTKLLVFNFTTYISRCSGSNLFFISVFFFARFSLCLPRKAWLLRHLFMFVLGCLFVAYFFFYIKKNRPFKPSLASAPDRSVGRNTQSQSTK